jgi:hypothetical protein
MAGRGRGMTLPSWMTSSDGSADTTYGVSNTSTVQPIDIPGNTSSTTNVASSPTLNQSAYMMPAAPNSYHHPLPTIVPTFAPVVGGAMPSYPAATFVPFAFPGQAFRGPVTNQPTSGGDPNNEKTNWSVHIAPDGKKYWYNRVTEQSTFDKPFCLKTPEERSIPPCKWKEYVANGQKYYSDGKDSV